MSTFRLGTIKLTTAEDLVDGLELRLVHAPLAKAEGDHRAAEDYAAGLRTTLGQLEAEIERLPPAIRAGRLPAARLAEALRDRDHTAGAIPEADRAVKAAAARVQSELSRAYQVFEVEVARRRERELQSVADLLRPLLEELNELDRQLFLKRRHPNRVPLPMAGPPLGWPASPRDANRMGAVRAMNMRKARLDGDANAQTSMAAAARHDGGSYSPPHEPEPPKSWFSKKPRGRK